MDNHKKRKTYSFDNSKMERIKNKKEIRLRLIKLTNNYFKPRCEHYINNIRSFNLKIMENNNDKSEIKKNKNFQFGKKKDSLIHMTDLSSYNIDIKPFIKNLKNEFTKEEIEIIKKNKEYYLTNELFKENISMFNIPPLYQIINKEEADEKKGVKVFHNLNYFNKKRRDSIMNINNIIQKKTSEDIIKDNIDNTIPKKLYKYENNITDNNMKNNYININKKERKKKKEENKDIIISKKLILDLEKESENEVKNFFKNKKELESKNKKNIFIITNQKKEKFPTIRNNTFNKYNKNNVNIKLKLSPIKRKEKYSKEKKPDLTKKNIDYELKIIRNINRKIKTIYENLNRKNNSIE